MFFLCFRFEVVRVSGAAYAGGRQAARPSCRAHDLERQFHVDDRSSMTCDMHLDSKELCVGIYNLLS